MSLLNKHRTGAAALIRVNTILVYRDVIIFEKLNFQDVLRPHEKAKSAFSS